MIAELRAYIDARIKAVDPKLEAQNNQVFGDDNPSKSLANKYYNLILGAIEDDIDDVNYIESMSFQIDIYVKPTYKAVESFDALYDKARDIRCQIISRMNLRDTIFFNIEAQGITPIQEISNDKAFRMQLEFICRHKYSID
jgi:hypothetical protein